MPRLKVNERESGQRLDRFLKRTLPRMPMGHIFKLIRTRKVRVNGKRAAAGRLLQAGDEVLLHISEQQFASERRVVERRASSLDFEVRYEDEDLLVVSKPPFLPVHPGAGHPDNSLIDQVHAYLEVARAGDDLRPALVHRLDRDTSGLLLIGKNYAAVRRLGDMFKQGRIAKYYLALCRGVPRPPRGTWEFAVARRDDAGRPRGKAPAAGRTSYRVASRRQLHDQGRVVCQVSLLVLRLHTGRTHQIRSHLLQAGHPLGGDRRYGDREFNRLLTRRFDLRRQFLHAYRLRLEHPLSGKPLELVDPYPDDLQVMTRALHLGIPPA
ncbi:MAG: hypothetical protein DRI34_14110 [Deltaproteobacteria bacterium]|nr:MAG: hypothetical protein DRI34_14110 [Deltaproteobacteria bacterium]